MTRSVPSGVSLGLKVGDIVQFDIVWPSLNAFDVTPLTVWAIVMGKTIKKTKEESNLGLIPYHKMDTLQLTISLAPKIGANGRDCLDSVFAAIHQKLGIPYDSPVERVDTPHHVFRELLSYHKLLARHIETSPAVETTNWRLVQSNLKPIEWATLLNLEKDMLYLLRQPTLEQLEEAPCPVPPCKAGNLFGIIDALATQFHKEF